MSNPHSYTIALLTELAEFLDGFSDVDDGTLGPVPNRAMLLKRDLDQEIERLKQQNGPDDSHIREAVNNALENAAIACEGTFGRAHTYASENADRYRIQDETTALCAKRVRALKRSSSATPNEGPHG